MALSLCLLRSAWRSQQIFLFLFCFFFFFKVCQTQSADLSVFVLFFLFNFLLLRSAWRSQQTFLFLFCFFFFFIIKVCLTQSADLSVFVLFFLFFYYSFLFFSTATCVLRFLSQFSTNLVLFYFSLQPPACCDFSVISQPISMKFGRTIVLDETNRLNIFSSQ